MLETRRDAMIDSVYPAHSAMRRIRLATAIATLALGAALPAEAQQYGGGTSVMVDYGVLDQLGAAPTPSQASPGNAPATVYTQPYGSLQPYGTQLQPYGAAQAAPVTPVQAANPYDSNSQLLPPPSSMPVSRLTVPYKLSPSLADNAAAKPTGTTATAKPVAFVMPATKPAEPPVKVAESAPAPETVDATAPSASAASTGTAASVDSAASNNAPSSSDASAPEPAASGAAGGTQIASTATAETASGTSEAASSDATTTIAANDLTKATDNAPAGAPPPVDTTKPAAQPVQPGTTTTAPEATTTTAPSTESTAPAAETATPSADQSQSATTPAETPATEPAQDKTQILFPEGSAELPPEATQQLDEIAQKLDQDQSLRLQLMAYASGTEDTASRARRISLSRALAVRAYLIDKGIRSTRMDVRALGNKVEGDPADRVDIVTLAPGG